MEQATLINHFKDMIYSKNKRFTILFGVITGISTPANTFHHNIHTSIYLH